MGLVIFQLLHDFRTFLDHPAHFSELLQANLIDLSILLSNPYKYFRRYRSETRVMQPAECFCRNKSLFPDRINRLIIMEDYAFIPSLGMTPAEFWAKANHFGRSNRVDGILAYMYTMLRESAARKLPFI